MAKFFLTPRDIISQVFSFLLGLAISTSPIHAIILLSTVTLLYLLATFVLPTVHPGDLLANALDQISNTRLWLDDEAATRRSLDMYSISARGYYRLKSVEEHAKALLFQHQTNCTISNAIRYATSLPKLLLDARKCRSDIEKLRADLETEVFELNDNSETRGEH